MIFLECDSEKSRYIETKDRNSILRNILLIADFLVLTTRGSVLVRGTPAFFPRLP